MGVAVAEGPGGAVQRRVCFCLAAARWRDSGAMLPRVKNWKECPAPGKKRPKVDPLLGVWKARAVFYDLPYWKVLKTPHSLDMMHITKNVTEIGRAHV